MEHLKQHEQTSDDVERIEIAPAEHHVEATKKHEHVAEANRQKAEQERYLTEATRKVNEKARTSAENNPFIKHNSNKNVAHTHHKGAFHEYGTKQTIKRIQKQLKNPLDRQMSKVIHSPIVETVSDVTGATIARPSGMLYGGIFSLVSSVILYLVSRHYGYEYSYSVGILFFIGGFFVGLILELILKPFLKKSS